MLVVPQRSGFPNREEFVGAVAAVFSDLWALYERSPVLKSEPKWARLGRGSHIFNVRLPLDIAKRGAEAHGLASAVKAMIEKHKSIKRIARVENDAFWEVWIETD